jgi:hypothetical protein
VFIYAPLEKLDEDIATMREAMREASSLVLKGFDLETDVKVVRYPDRYEDERGRKMWTTVMGLLDRHSAGHGVSATIGTQSDMGTPQPGMRLASNRTCTASNRTCNGI